MTTATQTIDQQIESLRKAWLGRRVYSSTDHQLDDSGKHPRPVTDIHYSAEFESFVAFAGEHHRANTAEALDRRLQSLAVR